MNYECLAARARYPLDELAEETGCTPGGPPIARALLLDDEAFSWELVYDLPAGGRRLIQKATGYDTTIVSGQPVYSDGEATGALPGKLIRGPQVRLA